MTRAYVWRYAEKMGSSHAASLKVIGTDMDRSDIYDFLLTFHGNHAPILYGFPDIAMY